MNDFSPADELRETLSKACEKLFDVSCDADMTLVGSNFSDVVLRIAFCYPLDAKKCADALLHSDITLYGKRVIAQARCADKYINITLCDEYLEQVADIIITKYPAPSETGKGAYAYAIQKAYMLSRQQDDFQRVIKIPEIRFAFLSVMKCSESTKEQAARAFLRAQESMSCYDGMGKVADAAMRVLYKYGKER